MNIILESDLPNKKTGMIWSLNNGILIIHGTGKIPDCDCGHHPSAEWKDMKDLIREIHIEEGITEIGIRAFQNCANLEKVILPQTLKRVHAYAFWNCSKLVCITGARHFFQYVLDENRESRNEAILFGLESFHGVPWSRSMWGDFYIKEGILYCTFACESKKLVIPEGVHTLKSFSMNNLDLDSLILPQTLTVIQDYAFQHSRVKEKITLPDTVTDLAEYALIDCSILWRKNALLAEKTRAYRKLGEEKRKLFPYPFTQYSLSAVKQKSFFPYTRLRVAEKKLPEQPDGKYISYIVNRSLDIGRSIIRRLKKGSIVLCITYAENQLLSVKSFAWDDYYHLPNEYLMYPIWDEDNILVPWSDSFTYQEEEDILYAFGDENIPQLRKEGVLRTKSADIHEEWFCSNDKGNFGGPLELDLLEKWLLKHPFVAVYSADENRQKDHYRWFVDV